MTSRRPGAPRAARRPVAASGGRRTPARRSSSRAAGSPRGSSASSGATGSSASARGPAAAARPRSAVSSGAADDGPGITITRRTLVLVSLIVIALAALVPAVNSYVAQRQQLASLRTQVDTQQSDVEDLQAQVDRWEDPAYVAAQARERLLFAMPGETQYRLTDTSGEDVPLTEDEQAAETATRQEWFSALWSSVEGASRLTPEDIPDSDGTGEDDAPTGSDTTDTTDDSQDTEDTAQ
ncbi:FtsB family cell division protein [Brachybacterium sp. DNPG3]